MIDVNSIRADTPGCSAKVHFNNAGASLQPSPVINAVAEYLAMEAVTGGYETADLKVDDINGFYESAGKLFNTSSKNIAFSSSSTRSYAQALSSIDFKKGDNILIAKEDYISNQIAFLSMQKRLGVNLLRAESLPEGGVDVDDMKHLMDLHHPKLVSLSHIPTNTGLIQPIEEVGTLCRERNILYLVDACQSAGQLPLDIEKIKCDFMTGTFRKFMRGPRGSGFLFVSDAVLKSSLAPLHVDMMGADWIQKDEYKLQENARRFEEWERSCALMAGCKASVDYALKVGLSNIQQHNQELCKVVRKKLEGINLTTLDKGKNLSSIITVRIPGKDGMTVLQALRNQNINTSIATRSAAIIDFDEKGVSWALRISPHYYNTEKEIDVLISALAEIIK